MLVSPAGVISRQECGASTSTPPRRITLAADDDPDAASPVAESITSAHPMTLRHRIREAPRTRVPMTSGGKPDRPRETVRSEREHLQRASVRGREPPSHDLERARARDAHDVRRAVGARGNPEDSAVGCRRPDDAAVAVEQLREVTCEIPQRRAGERIAVDPRHHSLRREDIDARGAARLERRESRDRRPGRTRATSRGRPGCPDRTASGSCSSRRPPTGARSRAPAPPPLRNAHPARHAAGFQVEDIDPPAAHPHDCIAGPDEPVLRPRHERESDGPAKPRE